jgi:Flp pilus assembly protein TadB
MSPDVAATVSDRSARRAGAARHGRASGRQLPRVVEEIALALEHDPHPAAALQRVVARTPDPLAAALRGALQAQCGGCSLARGLIEVRDRTGILDLTLLAHATTLAARGTEPPSRLFTRLARRLRAREVREARITKTHARLRHSAILVALLPLGMCAWLASLDPSVQRALFARPAGWLIASALAAAMIHGVVLLWSVARIGKHPD